jgi:glycosyltransferase involved in cell wall biosynthesis
LPEQPCVLFLGSLRGNKGVDVLLQAIASTPEEISFVVAGRGERHLEATLRRAVAADARLHVEIGYVTQQRKTELFRQASVVALPYTAFASQSGVLHDAYAHGRPVIVTDVGALGDTVREDETGIVVPPADADALAAAMVALVRDRRALDEFTANAGRIRDLRAPQRVGALLRDVYDTIAG